VYDDDVSYGNSDGEFTTSGEFDGEFFYPTYPTSNDYDYAHEPEEEQEEQSLKAISTAHSARLAAERRRSSLNLSPRGTPDSPAVNKALYGRPPKSPLLTSSSASQRRPSLVDALLDSVAASTPVHSPHHPHPHPLPNNPSSSSFAPSTFSSSPSRPHHQPVSFSDNTSSFGLPPLQCSVQHKQTSLSSSTLAVRPSHSRPSAFTFQAAAYAGSTMPGTLRGPHGVKFSPRQLQQIAAQTETQKGSNYTSKMRLTTTCAGDDDVYDAYPLARQHQYGAWCPNLAHSPHHSRPENARFRSDAFVSGRHTNVFGGAGEAGSHAPMDLSLLLELLAKYARRTKPVPLPRCPNNIHHCFRGCSVEQFSSDEERRRVHRALIALPVTDAIGYLSQAPSVCLAFRVWPAPNSYVRVPLFANLLCEQAYRDAHRKSAEKNHRVRRTAVMPVEFNVRRVQRDVVMKVTTMPGHAEFALTNLITKHS
jgi:hypothetical protein